jgi:hypothetical protein
MRIRDLPEHWEQAADTRLTEHEYRVRLTVHDAARIGALAEMYPGRSVEDIITDLLAAALADLEGSLPYVQGPRIIAEDERGDPIYEDIGPTPRYVELTRKHAKRLARGAEKES